MADATKCREETCPEPATHEVFGPHGAVLYCAVHAGRYAGLMAFMGAPTRTTPLSEKATGEASNG